MKREGYNDNGPSFKRPRHEEEVTFLIPSKVAGSIIGKGGANISKLRSQFNASISVPDCPGPERVLVISAGDVDTIMDIVKEILPNLAEAGRDKSKEEDIDVRMLIHQSRAGCVIGKGGSKIKDIREKTGARLKIFSNPAPQSTERVVQLLGNAEAVSTGIREVIDLVREVPIKGVIQTYDPYNYDDYYADEYGGYGQGGSGRGGRPSRSGGGPSPRAMGMGPSNRPRGPPRSGNGRGFGDFVRGSSGPGYSRGNFGVRAPIPPPFAPSPSAPPSQETSTQVTIPKDLAGAIIGKAGSRIRKIRAESGAAIEIAEPLHGSNDRIITITGTPQRIQMAQYLLQKSVHDSHPNLGRGNF